MPKRLLHLPPVIPQTQTAPTSLRFHDSETPPNDYEVINLKRGKEVAEAFINFAPATLRSGNLAPGLKVFN